MPRVVSTVADVYQRYIDIKHVQLYNLYNGIDVNLGKAMCRRSIYCITECITELICQSILCSRQYHRLEHNTPLFDI
jgi:hypothetical protein